MGKKLEPGSSQDETAPQDENPGGPREEQGANPETAAGDFRPKRKPRVRAGKKAEGNKTGEKLLNEEADVRDETTI